MQSHSTRTIVFQGCAQIQSCCLSYIWKTNIGQFVRLKIQVKTVQPSTSTSLRLYFNPIVQPFPSRCGGFPLVSTGDCGQRPKQSHSVKHSSNPPGGTHFLQRLKVKGVTEGSVGRYDWDPVNHLTPDYYLRLGERFYSQLHTHVYKSPPELTPPTFSVLRQTVKYSSQSWSHFDPETLQPCTWSSVLVFISRRLYWFISEFLQPIRFELSTNLYPQKDQITSYNSHTPSPAFGSSDPTWSSWDNIFKKQPLSASASKRSNHL